MDTFSHEFVPMCQDRPRLEARRLEARGANLVGLFIFIFFLSVTVTVANHSSFLRLCHTALVGNGEMC